MSDIEEKLRQILMEVANDYANSVNPELNGALYTGPDLPKAFEQIKQAFIDAGWQEPLSIQRLDRLRSEQLIQSVIDAYLNSGGPEDFVVMSRDDWSRNAKLAGVMTGQEWYDKFETELAGKGILYRGHPEDVTETILGCKLAAKRAAGLEL